MFNCPEVKTIFTTLTRDSKKQLHEHIIKIFIPNPIHVEFSLLFHSMGKTQPRKNDEIGNFQPVSAHLFAARSLAGSDRLQVELGIGLLHLLHTAVN